LGSAGRNYIKIGPILPLTTPHSLNITAITVLPEVEGDEEELKEGWDAIV
jgi:hypothetical protein